MEENNNNCDTAGKTYEYKEGEYTVSVSFSGDESLEDCLARYVSKCLEELLAENYNQIDNPLSNTAPGDDAAEKRRKESRKNAA